MQIKFPSLTWEILQLDLNDLSLLFALQKHTVYVHAYCTLQELNISHNLHNHFHCVQCVSLVVLLHIL